MCEFDGGLISILHHEEPLQNEPCYMSADVCKLPLELYTRNMSCSERLDIYKKTSLVYFLCYVPITGASP